MRKILTEPNSTDVLLNYYGQDFSYDIETTGLNSWEHVIVGIGFYFANGDAFYLVKMHTKEKWDGTTYLEQYLSDAEFNRAVSGLFNQPVRMVAHNQKFDKRFLKRRMLIPQGEKFDTLLAAKLLDENRPNGLKNLAKLVDINYDAYSKLRHYPGFGAYEILGVPLDLTAEYAMNDVEATYKLSVLFEKQLKAWKVKNLSFNGSLWDVFVDLWMPLSDVLEEMEEQGIMIDYKACIPAKDEYEKLSAHYEHLIRVIALKMLAERDPMKLPEYFWRKFGKNDPIDESKIVETDDGKKLYQVEEDVFLPLFRKTERSNWCTLDFKVGSPKQLYELIYKYSDIRIPADVKLLRNKEGLEKTDVRNIKTILYYMGDEAPEVLRWIIEWRTASKFISTYLDTFIEQRDNEGKIHTNFNQAETDQGTGGTTTHRLSSSGPNFQNISAHGATGKIARSLVIAEPENILVVADYNMMELRMFAHYSKDERMMQAFEEGRDLHVEMGAYIGQTTYDELYQRIKDGDEEAARLRQLGKTCNFSLGFGMLAPAFQRYLLVQNGFNVPLEEAQRFIDGHAEMWEGMIEWRSSVHEFVRKHGYVTSLMGSVRRLPEAQGRNNYERFRAERQAVSKIIQGSCAEVICASMIPLQAALKAIGGGLILQVHDELAAQVPLGKEHFAMKLMETTMVETCAHLLRVPMKVDAHAGLTWQAAKHG